MKHGKYFFCGLLTIILFSIYCTASARLRITNESNLDIITASCTGEFPPVSIIKQHPPDLAWSIIKLIIGGQQGSCVFYNGQLIIAAASIVLSDDLNAATITEFDKYDTDVNVTITPGIGIRAEDINVRIY